jgi:hypothetical protein
LGLHQLLSQALRFREFEKFPGQQTSISGIVETRYGDKDSEPSAPGILHIELPALMAPSAVKPSFREFQSETEAKKSPMEKLASRVKKPSKRPIGFDDRPPETVRQRGERLKSKSSRYRFSSALSLFSIRTL